jgi:diketogulonate reductase-like aldo/keto reductase
MTAIPDIEMNTGASIPQIGFGVYKIPDEEVTEAVLQAFARGYRSIDTAKVYENERGVGRAIAESGLDRSELFITTKLARADQGFDSALRAFDESLELLGLDYVDLYLIHWPIPSTDQYVATWKALEQIAAGGRARAIGVSNFQIPHLERLFSETEIVPAVNQIELQPYLPQTDLAAFHAEHGIVTEAWSPLAKGELLQEPVLLEIAAKHATTVAQVVLRWHLQQGHVFIPKTSSPERMSQNLDIFDFELSAEDFSSIATLNSGHRTGPHPDRM